MGSDLDFSNTNNHLLSSLLKEYEIISSRLDKTDERTIQFVGISVTLLTSWSVYAASQGGNFSIALAWLGPLLFLLVFAYLISIYYFHFNTLWISRILSLRINMILPEPAHITNAPGFPSAVFFSSRKGNIKTLTFYILIIGGLISLFVLVSYLSFRAIYSSNHLSGTLFIALYGSIALLELYAVSGLFIDLPNSYDVFASAIQETGRIPRDFTSHPLYTPQSNLSKFVWLMFPRPADVMAKGHIFWIGFIMAFFVKGLTSDRLPLLNLLFSQRGEWNTILDVPMWVVLAFGILIFVVEEILLQQAKLLWDDVRDVKRDKLLLQNRARAIASGKVNIKEAIAHLSIRWTLAMILSAILGGATLFLSFLAITIHQTLYVLWAKPKASKYPLLSLTILSFNVPLRFVAGAIAVSGCAWTSAPLLLTVALLFFYTFGGMAALWKMEAEYQEKTGKPVAIRPQSAYFLHKGYKWQHIGLLGAITLSLTLILLQKTALTCPHNALLTMWYATCSIRPGSLIYVNYEPYSAVAIIIVGILVNMAVCFPLSYISITTFSILKKLYRKLKGILVAISIAMFIYHGYHSVANMSESSLYWAILWLNTTLFLNYEQLTYPEYSFEVTAVKIKLFLVAIYKMMFFPTDSRNIIEVVKEISAIDPEKILFND